MKIKDILAKGLPSVSFEIFPPRSDSPFEPVKEAVERLARQRPSFMSVTYGASGNAQANTVEVASFVQKCGVPALAHLTCIAATKDSIDGEVAALRSAGKAGVGAAVLVVTKVNAPGIAETLSLIRSCGVRSVMVNRLAALSQRLMSSLT